MILPETWNFRFRSWPEQTGKVRRADYLQHFIGKTLARCIVEESPPGGKESQRGIAPVQWGNARQRLQQQMNQTAPAQRISPGLRHGRGAVLACWGEHVRGRDRQWCIGLVAGGAAKPIWADHWRRGGLAARTHGRKCAALCKGEAQNVFLAVPERRHPLNSRFPREGRRDHPGPAAVGLLPFSVKPRDIQALLGTG